MYYFLTLDKSKSKGDSDFLSAVLKGGTITDKVSAICILIQESPIFTLQYLQGSLLSMAGKKSRREAIMAIDSIVDLITTSLLPDRKLKFFKDQNVSSKNITNQHLVLFYLEDCLKNFYTSFVKILEELTRDVLLHVKNKVIIYIQTLLSAKPEQEEILLQLLVNKMGDQEKKISSKVVYLLLSLLQTHPNMKLIVIKEVEQILFRQNISQKTQYYAVTLLNQIILSSKSDSEYLVANHLIDVYFRLFEILVIKVKSIEPPKQVKKDRTKSKQNSKPQKALVVDGVDAKMMAGLLTGINRALPFSKLEPQVFNNHINMLFTLTHIGTFNTCIQALTLLNYIQQTHQSTTDRYYRALYQSLLDKRLLTASKQSLYLNLLFKSLKQDTSINRIRAFIKRILQVCNYLSIPFICASLFLIGQVSKTHSGIWGMVNIAEDGQEETFNDEETEKILKVDENLYDGLKRDPLFSNASKTCLWELIPYTTHFHPTVSLYAKTLLNSSCINPPLNATNYDPLLNHTLGRFLDRFVYKNPKNLDDKSRGNSLMQPRGIKNEDRIVAGGQKKRNGILNGVDTDDKPVNSGWDDQDQVPVDELFFYKFFSMQDKKIEKEEVVEGDSDPEEDQVWDAIQNSTGFTKDSLDEDDQDGDLEDPEDDLEYPEDDEEIEDADAEDVAIESDDDEMENWMQEEEEEEEEVKPIRGKKAIAKMAEKAKSVGFKGEYFDRLLKGEEGGDVFASIDEFESLINQDNEGDDGAEGIDAERVQKRRGKFSSRRSKYQKI